MEFETLYKQTFAQVHCPAGVDIPGCFARYNSLGLSTVDNIQEYSGYYSLVELFGGAKGDYGTKNTADSIVP